MPKFFYTVILATLAAWAGVFIVGSEIVPDSSPHILIFMFSLLVAVGISLTACVFVYLNRRASLFMDRHVLFKKSLKYGYFLGFFIVGILTLRVFDIATPLNYFLFTFLCLVLYKQFKSSRV